MLKYLQVENSFLAPIVVLAKVEGMGGRLMSSGFIHGIQVDLGRRRQNLAEVTGGPEINIVRSEIFTDTVFKGEMRQEVVREAFNYLVEEVENEYFQGNDEVADMSSQDEGVQVGEHSYAPARFGRRVRLRDTPHPYSQIMPMFFPVCRGDVDDPERELEVSESDWAIHFLRYVKKNLLEFPLFVITAAFRLDTAKIFSAYYNAASYTRTDDTELVRCEGFHLRQQLRGSAEYYAKAEKDMLEKSDVFGYPRFFFTFSNNPRWEITLSTALSQDGYDVWHKADERTLLNLLVGHAGPEDSHDNYYVHLRSSGNNPRDQCMFHLGCHRIPVSRVLEGMDVDKLLARNSYNIQRVFEHRLRTVVNEVLLSEGNTFGIKLYHTVKEFTEICPSGHAHGVAWSRRDGSETIFKKLHDGDALTEVEKESVVSLADSVISTSISADRLRNDFHHLSQDRAAKIAELAVQHQQHHCGGGCFVEKDTDGCGKHFPRLPCGWTVLTSPPPPSLPINEMRNLVEQCEMVKINVRLVLKDLRDRLDKIALVDVLWLALGDPTAYTDDNGIIWKRGLFPICETFVRWRNKFRSEGYDHVLLLSIYYTALSTSTWRVGGRLVYQLQLKREVNESFTVDYNPILLETMQSNMELSLVVFTPEKVLKYITKEQETAFSMNKARMKLIDTFEDPSLENILRVFNESRMLSLAMAFYRVDSSLSLSESNMPVYTIDTNLPHKRKRFFVKCVGGPDTLPGCHGFYREVPEMLDDYMANR